MKLLIDLLFDIESRWSGGGGQTTYPKKIELKSPPWKQKMNWIPILPMEKKIIVDPLNTEYFV